jgi:AcrR family transcriptional regulator
MDKGVEKVSLEQVAEAAGFIPGAVHWHFHRKIAIYSAFEKAARVVGSGGAGASRHERRPTSGVLCDHKGAMQMYPYTDDDDIRWYDMVVIEILLRSLWTFDNVMLRLKRLSTRCCGKPKRR